MTKIGEAKSKDGEVYDVFWNSSTGEWRVGGSQIMGRAQSMQEALRRAIQFTQTGEI
jgi:hypothetical protein